MTAHDERRPVSLRELAPTVLELARAGEGGRVGRVVSFRGFGGRRAGDAVFETETGRRVGTLLGGLADTATEAASRPPELVEVALSDGEAVSGGLACGGLASVLVSEVRAIEDVAWRALGGSGAVALVTRCSDGPDEGRTLALIEEPETRSFARAGSLGAEAADDEGEALARAALRLGRDVSEVHETESGTLVIEVFLPTTCLVVIGEGDLAAALEAQGGLLSWTVVVRNDCADETRALLSSLGSSDALVLLSHDHDLGTESLAAALRTPAYVGALGSRHTQAARRERLEALGLPEEVLARIHGPVGLDLGARWPAETAVAIVAEILAHRSGRDAASLAGSSGPING